MREPIVNVVVAENLAVIAESREAVEAAGIPLGSIAPLADATFQDRANYVPILEKYGYEVVIIEPTAKG